MAATYVPISREDFEAWLNSTGYRWKRDTSKAGVYIISLSDTVGIYISSSIGTRDDAMGRGKAAVHMKLVSLVTGHTLNKKGLGQSRFNRTTGWQKNFKKGLDTLKSVYLKAAGFYDSVARITDREKYKTETLAQIESISGWRANNFLADLHKRVSTGGVLTVKQHQALDRAEKKKPSGPTVEVDEKYLERVRELYRRSRQVNDQWLQGFVESVGKRLRQGLPLSPKQQQVLDKNLAQHRVARDKASCLALLWLRSRRPA